MIDGTLFHETAQQDSVSSAPTVLLDDDFRWTGQTDVMEIIKILSDRDPEKLGASSLETEFVFARFIYIIYRLQFCVKFNIKTVYSNSGSFISLHKIPLSFGETR